MPLGRREAVLFEYPCMSSNPFHIESPTDGSVARGSMNIVVICADAATYKRHLQLRIDGVDVGPHWMKDGVATLGSACDSEDMRDKINPEQGRLECGVTTNFWPNGTKNITVCDDRDHRSASVSVAFDNSISDVRLTGLVDLTGADGLGIELEATIEAVLSPPQDWIVEIDEVERRFTGSGEKIKVAWDGFDAQGDPAGDGSYLVSIQAGAGSELLPVGFIHKWG